MKQCTSCNQFINDTAKFCPHCGAKNEVKFQDSATDVYQATSHQGFGTNQPTVPSLNLAHILPTQTNAILSNNPQMNLLKKHGSNLTYFLFLIFYTLFACVALFYSFTAELPFVDYLDKILDFTGFSYYSMREILPYLDTITTVYRCTKLLGLLPIVLMAVGIWKIYFACKRPSDEFENTSGFTLIAIPTILSLIGYAISVLGVVIGGIILAISLEEGWVFLVALLLGASTIIMLIYHIMLLKLIMNLKNTVRANSTFVHISVSWFIIVLNFIIALVSLFAGGNGLFGNLMSSAATITITINMIQYKNMCAAANTY